MKTTHTLFLLLMLLVGNISYAQQPDGNEWQDPKRQSSGRLPATAPIWPFANEEEAKSVLPNHSSFVKSLNGLWDFHWVNNPDKRPADFYKSDYDTSTWEKIEVPSNWNVAGIGDHGTLRYGRPIYVNQKVIFQHSAVPDDWRGGVMRTPPAWWTTYTDRNEVGSYRRTFVIPDAWQGHKIFIRFDGVDSFFYLWINGHYIGFSKDSRRAAVFDITPYVQKGNNTVSAEVYRNSDGSFLEAQDMFRLPGIFRSVWVYATPSIHLTDIQARPHLDATYTNGELQLTAGISADSHTTGLKIAYKLYPVHLYSDSLIGTTPVAAITTSFSKEDTINRSTLILANPLLWSAELPHRYLLTASLQDSKGNIIETTSLFTGFRSVEIKESAANENEYGQSGRYFFINGKTVKLRGVNRHETDPTSGHAVSHNRMLADIMAMKRANINHVRNSHYPPDPYWYYLCDRYGIYLMDEANLETHEYYYGKASLSHVPEFKAAHVARVMDMAYANANHPSVVIWSLGNEAGPGINFKAAYDALQAFDNTRPINYERNNDYADFGSCQYPSVEWVDELAKGEMNDIKYPFHINEYAHSMGNSMGNLIDYWKAIESSGHIFGAAIWDWVDQAIYFTDSTSNQRYLAYGGDFGDRPNDGQFVMNGIMFADLTPKPQYYEVKKVYQPVTVRATNTDATHLEFVNLQYFSTLKNYTCKATLIANGDTVATSVIAGVDTLSARSRMVIENPFRCFDFMPGTEYFVNISFIQKTSLPWAEKGYEAFAEQIAMPYVPAQYAQLSSNQLPKLKIEKRQLTVNGKNFSISFNATTGSINEWQYNGVEIIAPGHGPRLDAFRAYINNDTWLYESLFANGLHNQTHNAKCKSLRKDRSGNAILEFEITSQAPHKSRIYGGTSSGHPKIEAMPDSICDFAFNTKLTYTITPQGSVTMDAYITSTDNDTDLARLGYTLELPLSFYNIEYYGRGPEENYADRKSGSFVGHYHTSVSRQFVAYPKPQNMGNHEQTRWVKLSSPTGVILKIDADTPFSFTALPYSEMELLSAPHPYQLPAPSHTHIHIDKAMTGLGGYSCGQGPPLDSDRVKAVPSHFRFTLAPSSKSDQ